MPDKAIVLANFKYGLDSRREPLALQPGTLLDLVDGHINQGGEVEKRKAFVNLTLTPLGQTDGATTFGLDENGTDLITFGSDNAPSFPVLLGNGRTVRYQRLQHPAVLEGVSYDPTKHAMTQLVYSENFEGTVFAAAKFADGRTFAYYGGVLVTQSRNGLVLSGLTSVASLSTELATQFGTLPQWLSTANKDEAGATYNGSTIVKSPIGIYFTPITSETSSTGLFGAGQIDVDGTPTAGKSAFASFTVTNGTVGVDTFTITAPKTQGGTGTATLVNALACAATATATATAIAAAINAITFVTGYSALTNGSTNVYVYAPAAWGASANGFTLTIVTTGTANWGAGGASSLVASATPATDMVTKLVGSRPANYLVRSDNISAVATGGTAPYTYAWSQVSGDAMTISTPATAAVINVSKTLPLNTQATGVFKCVVTDSAAGTTTTNLVSVTLSVETLN